MRLKSKLKNNLPVRCPCCGNPSLEVDFEYAGNEVYWLSYYCGHCKLMAELKVPTLSQWEVMGYPVSSKPHPDLVNDIKQGVYPS